MPKAQPKHIVTFSSEDPNHPASNLLNPDTYRKWKCQQPGEPEAFVVLQLEKTEKILSVDIGNECSAFVEILVGRSGGSDTPIYDVLQSSTVLMSPSESKSLTSPNRTKMFSDSLNKLTSYQKWDLIKVVCTQPFNRTIQYGLSFINIITHADPNEAPKIGRFLIKPVSGIGMSIYDTDSIRIGSMFAKHLESAKGQESQHQASAGDWVKSTSTSAAIRVASLSLSQAGSAPSDNTISNMTTTPKRKREGEADSEGRSKNPPGGTGTSNPKNGSTHRTPCGTGTADASIIRIPKKNAKPDVTHPSVSSPRVSSSPASTRKVPSVTAAASTATTPFVATKRVPTTNQKKKKKLPFSQLFSGVVFAISGYQNPSRSELRRKAIEMGGRYKQDWDSTCTHLICAFVNTPKFAEAKNNGNGKVVSKKWIEVSYNKRRRFPWRRYCLDRNDAGTESEDEIIASEGEGSSDMDSEDIEIEGQNQGPDLKTGNGRTHKSTDQQSQLSNTGEGDDVSKSKPLLNRSRRVLVSSSSSSSSDSEDETAYDVDTEVEDEDDPTIEL